MRTNHRKIQKHIKTKKHTRTVKNQLNTNQKIIHIMSIILLLGAIIGSIFANILNYETFANLNALIEKPNFYETFIKHSKSIIILWFCAFVAIGTFITYLIVFIKGLSIGFASSLIIRLYGFKGVIYCFSMFFMQNLILLPLYFFIGLYSINFRNNEKTPDFKQGLKEYIFVLIISALFILLVSLMDCVLTPLFLSNMS